jgi:histone deacetylase complex regulatory component SIN3
MNPDITLLQQYLKNKEFSKAIDQYIIVIKNSNDNDETIKGILLEIQDLQEKEISLSLDQLTELKSLFDSPTEEIQDMSLEIYITQLKRNPDYFSNEFE